MRLGYADLATRLRRCGSVASVWECPSCGDCDAHVQVRASCDSRVCPFCARVAARERASLVTGAMARVNELTAGEVATARARYERVTDDLVARGRVWGSRRGDRAASVRATLAREAAIAQRARMGLRDHERMAWSWKMITVSPPWTPDDPVAYTVGGLRARLDDLHERWSRLWREGLAVLGAASAYVRVELSAAGHVHLHVLYFGPWWSQSWLVKQAECHVWIERVDDTASAIREATKYALKSPTPGAGWITSARHAPHPELAARWQIATRNRRLCESYGVMRRAVALETLARGGTPVTDVPPAPPPAPRCASCGHELDGVEPRAESTAAVARRLGAKWSERGSVSPVRGALPARIAFFRV